MAIQALGPMPDAVLDVGCGSGILGIAALALGAGRVVGYDTDPLAIEATRQNAEVNGLSDQVTAHASTLPDISAERFPLVAANLVAAVLIELAPRLADHTAPTGTVIASGIIQSRRDEVEAALANAGLIVWERSLDGDWVTLRLVRSA
jgi:ribosomal protein L11 methyltransferase